MFYSAKRNTWFDPDSRGAYEAGGGWPSDAVEYPREVFDTVVSNRPTDKIMVSDESGRPVLVDLPAPSTAQLAAVRRGEVLAALVEIDTASARPLRAILVGSATDADRLRLTELDEQAAALRAELAALPA